MTKVLYLLDCLYGGSVGGSEKQFLKLQQGLGSIGVTPTIFFLKDLRVHSEFDFYQDSVALNITSVLSIKSFIKAYYVAQYMKENNIKIIHTLFDDATIFGALVKIFCPEIKLVSCLRNMGHARKGIKKKLIEFSYLFSNHVVVNAEAIKKKLVDSYNVDATCIEVIPNIVESSPCVDEGGVASVEERLKGVDYVVLAVSNLRPVKGLDTLVEAARAVSAQFRVVFVVLGEGGQREELECMIHSYGLDDVFILLGRRRDVSCFYRLADVAVLPSRSEGLSNSLIEYILHGIPTVATNVGGNPEVLMHGKVGILVEPDNPLQLSDALCSLLSKNDEEKSKLDKVRAELVEKYSEQSVLEKYSQFYRQLSIS